MMRHVLKLLVLATAAALALAPIPPRTVEQVYSRGIYPAVQPRLTWLTNRTPFAWFDMLLLFGGTAIVGMWVVRLRRGRQRLVRTIGGLTLDTAAAAALVYLWFLAVWGLNYRREPLSAFLDFREERITRENLRRLGFRGVESLNALHKDAHGRGWPALTEMPDVLARAFDQAQQELAAPWRAEPGIPKRSVFNFYFTRVSIDGMTAPFFLETLANQSLLPYERPATVAHEWAHLAGYADESEASFVGWLVCMRGSPSDRYSAWLSLYFTIAKSLPPDDRVELSTALAAGPREDLMAISERIQRQRVPAASAAGYAIYDRYLRANRVESGIRSYGEVIRLLLGTTFDAEGRVVLKH
jgi:hypothetical protein